MGASDQEAGEPGAAWPSARAMRLTLLVIAALAFVVRLIYVLEMRASPFFERPVMDPAYHVDWARAFARGEPFQPGPFFRAPLYPWFLGVLTKLFGQGLLAPRLVQCALGSATAVLTALVATKAFDRRTGLLAGLGAATYWVLVYFDGELLIPTLAIPLNLLALLLTLRLADDANRKRALLAGLAWGLAAIARPNVLLFMPVLFFWVLWLRRGDWKRGAFAAGALTLGTLVPILPLTVHNALQDDTVLIATQAGVNFWIGNNPVHAKAGAVSEAIVPGTRAGWWEGFEDARALAEAEEGRPLKDSEISRHYSDKAWSWISANPGDAFRHWLLKLRLFWSDVELGNNQPVRGFADRFAPITRLLPLGFGVVAPLGLVGLGLVLLARGCSHRRLLPLWGFLVVYTLSVVAFFVNARFRAPILPVLLILGAHAALWLVVKARAREWRPFVTALAAAVLLGIGVERFPDRYRQDAATTAYQLAVGAQQEGDYAAAERYLRESIEANPTLAQAHLSLGVVLRAQERLPAAEAALRQALEIDSGNREGLLLLGDLLVGSPARAPEALAVAQQLATLHASFDQAWYLLGRAYRAVENGPESVAAFRRGRELAPGDVAMALGLAQGLANAREYDASVPHFLAAWNGWEAELRAARAKGDAVTAEQAELYYWQTALQLYQVLTLAGRADEAQKFLQELQLKFPGDPRIAQIRTNTPR